MLLSTLVLAVGCCVLLLTLISQLYTHRTQHKRSIGQIYDWYLWTATAQQKHPYSVRMQTNAWFISISFSLPFWAPIKKRASRIVFFFLSRKWNEMNWIGIFLELKSPNSFHMILSVSFSFHFQSNRELGC